MRANKNLVLANVHLHGQDLVPLNLLSGDGQGTSESLEGRGAHGVVASVQSVVELALRGRQSLHGSGGQRVGVLLNKHVSGRVWPGTTTRGHLQSLALA